jgi:hypothetical protein
MKFLVVVMLTFMNGTVVQYNDGKWDTAPSFEACQAAVSKASEELKEEYKDGITVDGKQVKPSSFILACIQQ